VAQEKAQDFQGKKVGGQFQFTRDKTVYVNHYCFYIEDATSIVASIGPITRNVE
jgi:hypothetical protein